MNHYYVLEVYDDGTISPYEVVQQIANGLLLGDKMEQYKSSKQAHTAMLKMETENPNKSYDVFTVERTKF